jgi:DNA-directed RNA polymerase specialized sigma24 family protein
VKIVENMPPQPRAAVLLSARGGLRWGEVAELRRKDLSGNVVHVTRAVVRLPERIPRRWQPAADHASS